MPYRRKAWEHNGETVTKLVNPSLELKKKAVDLLFETGKYILETYDCFEEYAKRLDLVVKPLSLEQGCYPINNPIHNTCYRAVEDDRSGDGKHLHTHT